MIDRVRDGDIDFVIVHKVDRLARSRADDVEIVMAIRQAGAQRVSVTENTDETPSAPLLHGIMSSIAEFYSRNLAAEVVKGSTQKPVQLDEAERQRIRIAVRAHVMVVAELAEQKVADAEAQLTRLDQQERTLLAAHYGDQVSESLFAEEQRRISRERLGRDQADRAPVLQA